MQFDCHVEWIPGSENKVADAFSRYPVDKPTKEDEEDTSYVRMKMNTIRAASEEQAELSLRLEQVNSMLLYVEAMKFQNYNSYFLLLVLKYYSVQLNLAKRRILVKWAFLDGL